MKSDIIFWFLFNSGIPNKIKLGCFYFQTWNRNKLQQIFFEAPENINGPPTQKSLPPPQTVININNCHPEKFLAAPLIWEGCIQEGVCHPAQGLISLPPTQFPPSVSPSTKGWSFKQGLQGRDQLVHDLDYGLTPTFSWEKGMLTKSTYFATKFCYKIRNIKGNFGKGKWFVIPTP